MIILEEITMDNLIRDIYSNAIFNKLFINPIDQITYQLAELFDS